MGASQSLSDWEVSLEAISAPASGSKAPMADHPTPLVPQPAVRGRTQAEEGESEEGQSSEFDPHTRATEPNLSAVAEAVRNDDRFRTGTMESSGQHREEAPGAPLLPEDQDDREAWASRSESPDSADPYGGLIPVTDELDAPPLSLTQRHSIPNVRKSPSELASLPLDHRCGFLLAHVDGVQTLGEILDVCAMPADEALGLIRELEVLGVIEFE